MEAPGREAARADSVVSGRPGRRRASGRASHRPLPVPGAPGCAHRGAGRPGPGAARLAVPLHPRQLGLGAALRPGRSDRGPRGRRGAGDAEGNRLGTGKPGTAAPAGSLGRVDRLGPPRLLDLPRPAKGPARLRDRAHGMDAAGRHARDDRQRRDPRRQHSGGPADDRPRAGHPQNGVTGRERGRAGVRLPRGRRPARSALWTARCRPGWRRQPRSRPPARPARSAHRSARRRPAP